MTMTQALESREIPWRELGGMILLTAITIIIVIGGGSGGESAGSGTEATEPKAEAPKPEGAEKKPEQKPGDWKYSGQPGYAPSGDTSGQYRH